MFEKFKEKYKNVDPNDASKFYYGEEDDTMGRVLGEMQTGIENAVTEFEKIKKDAVNSNLHINIYIDQSNLKIIFSVSEYSKEKGSYIHEKQFSEHFVGEAMAEALVVMELMEESDYSTPVSQAVNNWVEDLNFDGFGTFGMDYDISDSYGCIDY